MTRPGSMRSPSSCHESPAALTPVERKVIDGLLATLFGETIGVQVPTPIPQITYQEAMARFGSDAPDMRYGLELVELSDLVADAEFQVFTRALEQGGRVAAIRVPGGARLSRKELDELTEFVAVYGAKGMAWLKQTAQGWQSPIAKFFSEAHQARINDRLGVAGRNGDPPAPLARRSSPPDAPTSRTRWTSRSSSPASFADSSTRARSRRPNGPMSGTKPG